MKTPIVIAAYYAADRQAVIVRGSISTGHLTTRRHALLSECSLRRLAVTGMALAKRGLAQIMLHTDCWAICPISRPTDLGNADRK